MFPNFVIKPQILINFDLETKILTDFTVKDQNVDLITKSVISKNQNFHKFKPFDVKKPK